MKAKKFWLFKELKNLFFVFGAAFIVRTFFLLVFKYLKMGDYFLFGTSLDPDLLASCTFAPLTEEIIFRWMPITFLLRLCGKAQFNKYKWYIAALLSIIFGVSHNGYYSIFVQGVGGFFYCYLYFKNRYGYVSAVIAHSLWNLTLGFILPSLGNFHPNPFNF